MNLGGTVRLNKFGIFVVICLVVLIIFYMSPRNSQIEKHSVNLRHLLLASIEIAERGGKEVVKAKNDPNIKEMSKGKTKEGADIKVTSADIKSDCAMLFGMSHLFPHIKVISEEKSDAKKCSQLPVEIDDKGLEGTQSLKNEEVDEEAVTVWIDPLDATQEFTENLLEYVTTMVCIAVSGRPVIGVIHRPFAEEHKTAWAWVNHAHSSFLKENVKQEGDQSVIISRSHSGDAEKAVKLAFGDTQVIKAGGSGYKVLQLMAGNASTYFHMTDIHKWDICAGDAIVTALGGRFTTLNGEDINYSTDSSSTNQKGLFVSLNPDTHDELAEKLIQAVNRVKRHS